MVVCCAGPVLLAAGGLSVLAAALHSLWLLVGAAVIVLAAAGLTVRRLASRDHRGEGHRGTSAGVACCPPGWPDHPAADSSQDPRHGGRPHDSADPSRRTTP